MPVNVRRLSVVAHQEFARILGIVDNEYWIEQQRPHRADWLALLRIASLQRGEEHIVRLLALAMERPVGCHIANIPTLVSHQKSRLTPTTTPPRLEATRHSRQRPPTADL